MTDGQPEPSNSDDQASTRQAVPSQDSGAARNGSRWGPLIALVLCLCVAVAGVSAAVFSSSSGHPGDRMVSAGRSPVPGKTPAAQRTASGAPGRAAARPEAAGDGIARSALRWPPHLKNQILRWEAGSGGAALAAVEQQLGNAAQAAGIRLYAPARQACVGLASDISTAQAGPPIPYDPMQRLYAGALSGLSRAAADCRTAISVHADGDEGLSIHVDHALLGRLQAEFAIASKKLYRATATIQALPR